VGVGAKRAAEAWRSAARGKRREVHGGARGATRAAPWRARARGARGVRARGARLGAEGVRMVGRCCRASFPIRR